MEGLRKPEELIVIVVTDARPTDVHCKPLFTRLIWTNEPWSGGKNGRVRIAKRSTRIRWCKPNWICNTSRQMKSERKAAR
jgi:hypothetical protein